MEIIDDIVEVPAESAANAWINRFIKRYKYGIDESVTVKHGKITWTGDSIYKHSIYLDKDKFIIDGNQIFITAELWAKYVKMRELTGSVLISAPKKIAFPYDWSALSDEQVLENVQYLQKNYKKYQITSSDDNVIQIDNIKICRDREGNIGNGRTFFTINGKKYYRNEMVGKEIIDLMHLCKMHMVPFKEKAVNWVKQNKNIIIGSTIFILFSNVAYFVGAETLKEEIKQETQKGHQKIINYNDSIRTRD